MCILCAVCSIGTGKTAVATYLTRRCKRAGFGVHYIRANSADDSSPFSIIRRLILELAGALSSFIDEASQREVVMSLLRTCFGKEDAEQWPVTRFPALRLVLGLQWELSTRCEGYYDSDSSVRGDTIPRILAKLLSPRSLLVVIDNAHFMCCDSWHIITQLSSYVCHSVVVLTVRVDDNKVVFDSCIPDSPAVTTRSLASALYDTLSEDTNTLGHISYTAGLHLRKTLLATEQELGEEDVSVSEADGAWGEAGCPRGGLYRHQTEYDQLYFKCHPSVLSELHLRPLNVNSVKTLLLKSFENSSYACEKMIRTVYRISKGNPFWCWKIIKFVQNSGDRKHTIYMAPNALILYCIIQGNNC